MAALFVLALGLIVWQAPRTKPLPQPWYVSVLKPGEQVFPVAVPEWNAPQIPAETRARLTFLGQHAVLWPGVATAAAPCDLFVRISLQHWMRRPVAPERLAALREDAVAGPVSWATFHWTGRDLLDDKDGDGDPLDPAELHAAGPGAETEVFCHR